MTRIMLLFAILSSLQVDASLVSSQEGPPRPETPKTPLVFSMSREGLLEAKELIKRKDPQLQVSFRKLLEQADKALKLEPFSVMQKTKMPPSGDKHDYMSMPPYAGMRDGITNPAWYTDYDRVPLERLTQATETLALTYYFTGEQRYAEKAAQMLRVWFLDPETRMNPDLKYAQRNTFVGVIDTRFMPRIVDAIGLLHGSGSWTDKAQSGMVKWFMQFRDNLKLQVEKKHSKSGHNIASWYNTQMASMSLFTGDLEYAKEVIERTGERMNPNINEKGGFKPELGRNRSYSYSIFQMYALFNLMAMGQYVDVDLWSGKTETGRNLHRALDYLAQYAEPESRKKWPHKEIERGKGDWWNPPHDMLPIILYHAAKAYKDQKYRVSAEKLLGDEVDVARLHLMCRIPIRWVETVKPPAEGAFR